MLVNKLGVDVLLLMLCRLRFCKSFQSDNCCVSNYIICVKRSFFGIQHPVSSFPVQFS